MKYGDIVHYRGRAWMVSGVFPYRIELTSACERKYFLTVKPSELGGEVSDKEDPRRRFQTKFDRDQRLWMAFMVDDQGNQIGTPEYHHDKETAIFNLGTRGENHVNQVCSS